MNKSKFSTTKSPDGTSFHGSTIKASVSELKSIIGQPEYSDNDGRDKTNFDWTCQNSKGEVFTVYDWKEYKPLEEDEEIIFHIGGRGKDSTDRAKFEIEKELELYREHQ